MSDLISRQAAIDALEREKTYCTAYKEGYTKTDVFQKYNMGLTDGIKALNKLPSAQPEKCEDCGNFNKTMLLIPQPERKHGEWIDDGGLYRCSSCNHLWSELWWTAHCPIERMLKIMPYCPNCGAKMDGGKDDG